VNKVFEKVRNMREELGLEPRTVDELKQDAQEQGIVVGPYSVLPGKRGVPATLKYEVSTEENVEYEGPDETEAARKVVELMTRHGSPPQRG
jgi:hypothetical protein